MEPEELEKLRKFLMERSELDPVTGCQNWKGYIDRYGYGHARWKGKTSRTHRLAFMCYNNGTLPTNDNDNNSLVIRHMCNNKPCIAEPHLKLGTQKENANDKKDHGTLLFGEKHSNAKITEELAKKIIESKYPEDHPDYKTQKERAAMFGVAKSTIKGIDSGANWKHLPRTNIPSKKPNPKLHRANTSAAPNATIDEETAKLIIGSKKHKYDPEYLTQEDRAEKFNTTIQVISEIDINRSWQYLPRPEIIKFRRPKVVRKVVWDDEKLSSAFKRVKAKCKYDDFNNEFVGSSCLVWQGKLRLDGRPVIRIRGLLCSAYIFACAFQEKRWKPEELLTRHLCGNEKCCEPTHLKFGTATENAHDARVHNKSKTIKLSYEMADEIRKLRKDGKTIVELAMMFDVTFQTIRDVVSGRSWVRKE